MTSQYWDAGQANAYHQFQYHFPEKTLAGNTIIVAGGSGAWVLPLWHCSLWKAPTWSSGTAPIANPPRLCAAPSNLLAVAVFPWSPEISHPPQSARLIWSPRRKLPLRLPALSSSQAIRRAFHSKIEIVKRSSPRWNPTM